VPFKKNILVTIEHGQANREIADYSSTAYWYQMEPHKPFRPLPVDGQRIPLRIIKPAHLIEAENLQFQLEGLKSKIVDMSEYGPEWGGNKQIVIESRDASSFGLMLNGLKKEQYEITLFYTLGPDYGDADILINNKKMGEIRGYSPYILPFGKVIIPAVRRAAGSETITLRFVITGKDPSSKGYKVGLDGIHLVPQQPIKEN
jgi:hypothetical protein